MRNGFKFCFCRKVTFIAFALMSCCIILLVACDNSYDTDGKHPLFVKAENFYDDGKYDEAIPFYQKYLDINPKSSKASYRLANIFQQKKNYIQAIFYYEKYLTLNPNSSDKEIMEKWIQASKESLAKQLFEQYPNSSNVNADKTKMVVVERKNEKLQDIISKQKNEPQKVDSSVSETLAGNVHKNDKQSTSVKYYTVQEGDNFQRISRKFYGSSKYYKLIIEANKDTLKGSTVLKIGDKIIISSLKVATTKKEN